MNLLLETALKTTTISLCCFLFSFSAFSEFVTVDETTIKVDGHPILLSEINDKIRKGQITVISSFPSTEKDSDFTKAAQDAVNYRIVFQKLEEASVIVDDSEVEQEIEKFIQKNPNLTKERLIESLAQEGLTMESYKEDYRKLLIAQRFRGRFIAPSVKISDREIRDYYLTSGGSINEESLMLDLDFIQINDSKDRPADKRAGEIIQKLNVGTPFIDAMKLYSDAPGASEGGGVMNSTKMNDLNATFRKALKGLKEGERTTPVKVGNALFIFQVRAKRLVDDGEFVKIKPRIRQQLQQSEMIRQTDVWISRERKNFKINFRDPEASKGS